MALETYDNDGAVFLKISHGCICQTSKTERDGYKKIEGTLRDGTSYVKWIKPYKAVSGYVTKIEWYDREYNGRKFRGWNIHIDADGTPCTLDIAFDSRVNSRWMKIAENIDFRKPVRFSAWNDKKTDTTAFNVQQDGVSVPQKYIRDNMGDCPLPVQRASGKWDFGAQEDYLCEQMLNTVIPTVEAAQALRPLRNEQSERVDTDPSGNKGLESDDPYRDAPDPTLGGPPDDLDMNDAPF